MNTKTFHASISSLICSLMLTGSAFAAEGSLFEHVSRGINASAGMVLAAGWTGGTKMQVVPVRDIKSAPIHVAEKDADKPVDLPFTGAAKLVETVGNQKMPRGMFDGIGGLVGLPALAQGEKTPFSLQKKNVANGTRYVFVVRRRPQGNLIDIMFFQALKTGDQFIYATSVDGVLSAAISKKLDKDPVKIALATAKPGFDKAVAFWKQWEVEENRRIAEAGNRKTGTRIAQ